MTASASPRVDPVTLEVIGSALPAITNEMAADLRRASYNMMIYEVQDFCCALVDPMGDLVAQNTGGVSHFVADLGVVVEDGMRRHVSFSPGDVVITNHQAVAGQHLNNVTVYTPVFWEQRLVCFAMVRAHWVDVGGLSTGFGALTLAADPWMEGLQLDQLKLHDAGEPNETLLQIIRDNVRMPEAALGDLQAQISACRLGSDRLCELYAKYGAATVEDSIQQLFDEAERRCRRVVAKIPDGTYEASAIFDDDGTALGEPVDVHAVVTVVGEEMTIDLSGCSQQRAGAINGRTHAGAFVAYKALTTPQEAVNAGSFRALTTIIPEGNVMMARYPAPMAGWSLILPTVVDTIVTALAPALRDRVPAAHLGVLGGAVIFIGVDPATGAPFTVQSLEGGGWGGRPHEDGESAAVSVIQGDVRNAPIESIELRCPVIVEQRALRLDSGGPGRHRGGLALT